MNDEQVVEVMALAAAKSYHAEVGRRSGVNLAWETSYDSEQADFLRVSADAIEAALAALRAAGFDVYRPDECALFQSTGVGAYRLVPVGGEG